MFVRAGQSALHLVTLLAHLSHLGLGLLRLPLHLLDASLVFLLQLRQLALDTLLCFLLGLELLLEVANLVVQSPCNDVFLVSVDFFSDFALHFRVKLDL